MTCDGEHQGTAMGSGGSGCGLNITSENGIVNAVLPVATS